MAPNEIILYGTVGSSWWDEEYFTAKQVREQLAQMTGDIIVRINSGGGIASEGQAIYTMLSDHAGKVTVMVEGCAASAASLIAMSGDEIIFRRGAWMLIHDPATPYTMGRGTEDDHIKEAELLRVISNAYADIYAARLGMSRDEARKVMKDETVMDGEMAVGLGFATSVETEEAVAAAMFDYRMYANAPEEVRKASKCLGRAPERKAVMAMIAGHPRSKERPKMTEVTSATVTEETSVTDDTTTTENPDVVVTEEPAAADAATATIAERARAKRINDAVAAAGLPQALASDLIGQGVTLEAALDKITAQWKENGDMDTPMPGRETARITRDERETLRMGMAQAIYAQLTRKAPETAAARPYMTMSVVEMAATALGQRLSMRTAYDRERVIEMAMHSTSDFPVIFENALNKRLLDAYQANEPTYRSVAVRQDFLDFRPHPMDKISDFPTLLPVNEGGEIKFGTLSEKKETVALGAYARAMTLSRQMLINDDMGAIDRLISTRGRTVAAFEDATFWAVFLSGANADGPTLTETTRQVFNATDGTKAGTAAAITVASLGLARAALRKQKAVGGETDIGWMLNRFILLVGPDKETEAQQIVAPIQAQQAGNVNPFAGTLTVVCSPKITGNAWYLLSVPEELPNFMYGFLQGAEGPRMRMDEPFGRQGVSYSVEHDFGCGAIEYRGGFKNAGA